MPIFEKTPQEILIEQLAGQVSKLTAEVKAKEASCKELNGQILELERTYREKTDQLLADYETRKAMLTEAIAPLDTLRLQLDHVKSELAHVRQEKHKVLADMRAEKTQILHEANQHIAEAQHRHQMILAAIHDHKTKVAAL